MNETAELLVKAVEAQAKACETTAHAMGIAALSARLQGHPAHADTHVHTATGMREFAEVHRSNLECARSDSGQVASMLQKYPPSVWEKATKIEVQNARRCVRVVKYNVLLAKIFRRDMAVLAILNEETQARATVLVAWIEVAEAWKRLRESIR